MGIIKAAKLAFDYLRYEEEGEEPEVNRAIDHVDLDIEEGKFIAILGHNGSGKSTLAKHINGLLVPTEGTLWVDHMDTASDADIWNIRQKAGMVFQNPDNQIIGTVVEEDVGFGPENLGVPTEDIWKRVDESLKAVGMTAYRHHSPNKLSGGQKQRVAIAGVMAMHPKCIVLDEPTAMLDPNGRKEVLKAVRELNKKEGVTVILITHYMEEVVFADDVYVMDRGHIVMHGVPKEIFSRVDQLKKYRLDVPQVTLLAYDLKEAGLAIPDGILTIPELVDALSRPEIRVPKGWKLPEHTPKKEKKELPQGKESIKLEHVGYTYNPGSAYEMHALKDVNLEIPQGQFVGIIGHTGSGKSTIAKLMLRFHDVSSGSILLDGKDIRELTQRELRKHISYVPQKAWLFSGTIASNLRFGNDEATDEEIRRAAKIAQAADFIEEKEEKYDSPIAQGGSNVSGGQKQRLAIARAIAKNPKIFIFDDSFSALDMKTDAALRKALHENVKDSTIILVAQRISTILHAEQILVLDDGRIVGRGTHAELLAGCEVYQQIAKSQLSAKELGLAEGAADKRADITGALPVEIKAGKSADSGAPVPAETDKPARKQKAAPERRVRAYE